jgi:hypothetical protein
MMLKEAENIELAAMMLEFNSRLFLESADKAPNDEIKADAIARGKAMQETADDLRAMLAAWNKARLFAREKRHNTDRQSIGLRGTDTQEGGN